MGVYEMGPCCSHPPVSDQKHVLDIEDAPSATCWSVLEGERWPGSQPGRVPWDPQPLWGDTACPLAADTGTCHRCPTVLRYCCPPRCQSMLVSICGLQDFRVSSR